MGEQIEVLEHHAHALPHRANATRITRDRLALQSDFAIVQQFQSVRAAQ